MKKFGKLAVAALLIGVLAIGLVGCGSGDSETGQGQDGQVSASAEKDKDQKDKKEEKEKKDKNNESKQQDKKSNKSNSSSYCTIYIECKKLLSIKDEIDGSVASQIPSGGVILGTTKVKIQSGDTVFDVIKRVTRNKGIHMAYRGTTKYGTAYIEGIHNIYEKDGGSESGWKYSVNGSFPNKGCSAIKVKNGDKIVWTYVLTA